MIYLNLRNEPLFKMLDLFSAPPLVLRGVSRVIRGSWLFGSPIRRILIAPCWVHFMYNNLVICVKILNSLILVLVT